MLCVLCALWLVGSAPAAHATVMRRLSLEELALGADAIVHGVVVRAGTQGAASGNPMPFSVARIAVLEWIAGNEAADHVIVREPGARWRGKEVRLMGAPRYREGDEVLVFLARRGAHYRTYGMSQGVFLVAPSTTGPRPAHRELEHVSYLEPRAGGSALTHGEPEVPLALSALLETVRAIASYRP